MTSFCNKLNKNTQFTALLTIFGTFNTQLMSWDAEITANWYPKSYIAVDLMLSGIKFLDCNTFIKSVINSGSFQKNAPSYSWLSLDCINTVKDKIRMQLNCMQVLKEGNAHVYLIRIHKENLSSLGIWYLSIKSFRRTRYFGCKCKLGMCITCKPNKLVAF